MKSISVATFYGRETVLATLTKHFAVHHPIGRTSGWYITHQRTGTCIPIVYKTKKSAVTVALALEAEPIGWNRGTFGERLSSRVQAKVRAAESRVAARLLPADETIRGIGDR